MRIKKQSLYTSNITAEDKAWASEYFVEAGYAENMESIDEYSLMDYLNDDKRDSLDDLIITLNGISGTFIAFGDLGTWRGRRDGFKWAKSKKLGDALIEMLSSDYNEVDIFTENGDLKITGYHHDATDYLTLRRVITPNLTLWTNEELKPAFRKKHTRGLAEEVWAKW